MASNAMKFAVTTTDGTTKEVQAIFADLIRYDVLRDRFKFPPREGNEFLFMGLVCYCAMLRTGQVSAETKPDDFMNTIANLEPAVEDEAEFRADTSD